MLRNIMYLIIVSQMNEKEQRIYKSNISTYN